MTDWRRIAARMRGDLDRAAINGRARRLAEFAIKATLMRGRTRVVIPRCVDLCRLLKIGQNHVAETVAELSGAGVLTVKEQADGWELLVYPDAVGWSVQWIYLRSEMDTFLSDLERAPGQCQGELLEPEPCLAKVLADVSALNAEQRAESREQKWGTSQNGKSVVPEMGRGVPTVNSNTVTVHSLTALKQSNSEQLTGARLGDEADVMEALRGFVGPEDVEQWGGDWRKNWVRKYPQAFRSALTTLIEESRSGWAPKRSRGAALKDLTRRYAR